MIDLVQSLAILTLGVVFCTNAWRDRRRPTTVTQHIHTPDLDAQIRSSEIIRTATAKDHA